MISLYTTGGCHTCNEGKRIVLKCNSGFSVRDYGVRGIGFLLVCLSSARDRLGVVLGEISVRTFVTGGILSAFSELSWDIT